MAMYGTLSLEDMGPLTERFLSHEREVRRYFAHRPDDLLVFPVGMPRAWEELGRFLVRRVGSGDFPWRNRRYRRSLRNLIDFVLP